MTYSHQSKFKAHPPLVDGNQYYGEVDLPGFRKTSQAVTEARFRYGLSLIPQKND